MIDLAIILCGGKGTRFGADKPLTCYRGRTIISHVLEAVSDAKIERVILQANIENHEEIQKEAEKYLDTYLVDSHPPNGVRRIPLKFESEIRKGFYLIAGNQPLRSDHLEKLKTEYLRDKEWALTLYPWEISDALEDDRPVSISDEGYLYVTTEKRFIAHLPAIIDARILCHIERENFQYRIIRTFYNALNFQKIHGVIANMPPECDDEKMFKKTRGYIDALYTYH